MLPNLKQKKTMVGVCHKMYPNNYKGHFMFTSVTEKLEAKFMVICLAMIDGTFNFLQYKKIKIQIKT